VIDCSEGQIRAGDAIAASLDPFQARSRAIVQKMPIDMKQCKVIAKIRDDVIVPNFVEERARLHIQTL
jgi:hypothetical protein